MTEATRKKKIMKPFRAWIGLLDGKALFRDHYDSDCDLNFTVKGAVLYKSEREVKKRFYDYALVEVRAVKR